MKIEGFIWYSDILEKLENKHNVSTNEVESLFDRKPITRKIEKGHFQGENLYRALRQSHNGRYLAVFFIYKATRERRYYEKRKK